MKNNLLFALMDESSVIYEVYIFCGHLFRVYPNGHIKKAGADDIAAAKSFKYI